jgi:aminoglycoside phosphotransferase family enzyme
MQDCYGRAAAGERRVRRAVLLSEARRNRRVLGRNAYQLPADRIRRLCDWHRSMLRICLHWLEERMHGTHIVEGHGDLRPEHVCIRERIDYLGLAERHQACASAVSEPPS